MRETVVGEQTQMQKHQAAQLALDQKHIGWIKAASLMLAGI
jgi:hypothetical protein